jgi:hypothetical protein
MGLKKAKERQKYLKEVEKEISTLFKNNIDGIFFRRSTLQVPY